MDDEKNAGVTESRFALTLLICLLFAVGYVALLRLAGPKDTINEAAPDGMHVPYAGPGPTPPADDEPHPRVLPIEKPSDGQIEISRRPKRIAPESPISESERR